MTTVSNTTTGSARPARDQTATDPPRPARGQTATDPPRPARGYTASKEQVLRRLARVQGQVNGIARMVEDDRYCIDVLTQIAAAQAALDKIALGLLDGHARHCMQGEGEAPQDPAQQVDELMGAVGRLVHR